jgi:hypothetical protein
LKSKFTLLFFSLHLGFGANCPAAPEPASGHPAEPRSPAIVPGATELSPSRSEYFSWINNRNEGSTEAQTLINLEFFKWLHDEYEMQFDIYAFDAGNIDGPQYYGRMDRRSMTSCRASARTRSSNSSSIPVQCAARMNEKVICADKNRLCVERGSAAAADRISELTSHYNTGLLTAGNKWNHMMSPAPGPWADQFRQFDMPPLSDFDGFSPPMLGVAAEGGAEDAVADLSAYTQGRRFLDLFNEGKGPIDADYDPLIPLDEVIEMVTVPVPAKCASGWVAGELLEP